jgi:hypothetical protein
MEIVVTETTNRAASEFGMRTFDAQISADHVVEIAISQRVRERCPGEIHQSDELLISNQVIRNNDLFSALSALMASALAAPAQSLRLS